MLLFEEEMALAIVEVAVEVTSVVEEVRICCVCVSEIISVYFVVDGCLFSEFTHTHTFTLRARTHTHTVRLMQVYIHADNTSKQRAHSLIFEHKQSHTLKHKNRCELFWRWRRLKLRQSHLHHHN